MPRKANKFSKAKYEEKVLNQLNQSLRRDLSDIRLRQVSITHVELNKDYSVCKVYWDTFDTENLNDYESAIKSSKKKLRTLLAQQMEVRHVPELYFHYNSQFEDEARITRLLSRDSEEE